jgi:hypothetical protein
MASRGVLLTGAGILLVTGFCAYGALTVYQRVTDPGTIAKTVVRQIGPEVLKERLPGVAEQVLDMDLPNVRDPAPPSRIERATRAAREAVVGKPKPLREPVRVLVKRRDGTLTPAEMERGDAEKAARRARERECAPPVHCRKLDRTPSWMEQDELRKRRQALRAGGGGS